MSLYTVEAIREEAVDILQRAVLKKDVAHSSEAISTEMVCTL